ncbi:glycoside hydrolase family 16 protein [Wilcoxina mikolae CBS 423.85]|nr:glycoside hydrolase family 16 protein [Wilcoxina mikolae CBS 423.85]
MLVAQVIGVLAPAISLLLAPLGALADCECGYSVNTSDDIFAVFTDVLESDFTTLKNISDDTDWIVQKWKVEKKESKGPYGRQTELKNVVSNPLKEGSSSTGILGGDPGLELWVRSAAENDEYVSVAEVDSARTDMLYGTFRAGIRTSPINGTCAAFFWYLNDTQEIDMEFLSSQMNETYAPVNLVLHSVLSMKDGGDASLTPTYKIFPLPFNPTADIHEYRFDWQPGTVSFYGDGKWLIDMVEEKYIPKAPGKIVLSHWSNGQPLWSGGPPKEDAKMLVSYVKAYFNSSDQTRLKDHAARCSNPSAANAICRIPDKGAKPGDTYFFSQDPSGNKTNNQSIHALHKHNSSTAPAPGWATVFLSVTLAGVWLVWGM